MSRKDPDIIASRAIEPTYFTAPWPEKGQWTPDPYQHAAVEYRIARRHALIGDAPGIGKTAEALLFGNSIQAEWTLIVCPAQLRLNWAREVKMWSIHEDISVYVIAKSKDGTSEKHKFVIISYDLLRNKNILAALMDVQWDHLIMDEAHALKDPKGNARTLAICGSMYNDGLADVADRITMLSGTILPNQPIECYNAVRLLNWEAIDHMSLEEFREEYYEEGEGWVRGPVLVSRQTFKGELGCNSCRDTGFRPNGRKCGKCIEIEPRWVTKQHYSTHIRNRPVNLDDLQFRLRKHVMVRRLKEDVLTQLPEKRWNPFPIETTPGIKKALKHPGWVEVKKLYELNPEAFDSGVPVDGAVSTAMRLLGEAKAPIVADYIEELLNSGVEKIVVGAWHRTPSEEGGVDGTGLSVLHYLRKRLKKYGLVYMDGTTSAANKQKAVDEFQGDEGIRIMEGQLLTLGEGWTLTEAQDGVLAEFYWTPGKNDQFLDRMHRRGQEGDYVLGHVPIVPGSMDERVVGTAVAKDGHIHLALDA